jgi:hypothetical protein
MSSQQRTCKPKNNAFDVLMTSARAPGALELVCNAQGEEGRDNALEDWRSYYYMYDPYFTSLMETIEKVVHEEAEKTCPFPRCELGLSVIDPSYDHLGDQALSEKLPPRPQRNRLRMPIFRR